MIEKIVPSYVVAVDTTEASLDGALFPEEETVIAAAVEKRRREFTNGRICARHALQRLGEPSAPVMAGDRGEPLWPDGVVGSITHCSGYCGAVLGRRSTIAAIGIDAERHAALSPHLRAMVAVPDEQAMLDRLLAQDSGIRWDRVLFSAKEAVYKAWYPLTGRWLGFRDARLVIERDGTFSARLPVDGSGPDAFSGRWLVEDGLILTAIVVGTGFRDAKA
ncbi:4'-phosphopantetheinyl transferase family protein [Microtetraspora malaysiensis]|uniref:4'-phosphopantetheinyl transferase family protein n=1 Tax=Microtetraspora malaysiensis TaxID=161358 RepID=UPI003D9066DD